MQSTEVLEDSLGEGLALDGSELKLGLGRLAGAVSTREGTSTPGATTVDLLKVGHLGESVGVTEGHVDDTVVSKSRHSSNGSGLLTTTEGAGGDEETSHLAVVATAGPLSTSAVPESLHRSS
jgi:hypothetical protein